MKRLLWGILLLIGCALIVGVISTIRSSISETENLALLLLTVIVQLGIGTPLIIFAYQRLNPQKSTVNIENEMTELLPSHTDKIMSLLRGVEADRDALLKQGFNVSSAADAKMFPLDFMALGAVKRNISTTRAFIMMIESWNMVCARSLLRIHIDTSLRFSAAWLVDDPHEFATQVLKGEQINKMKDKNGKLLFDAHLVNVRSSEYPWLPDVYANLSGYIHFSGSHIYDSIANVTDGDGGNTISIEVSETDLKFPEFSWIEILECFRESTAMLEKFLHGYNVTKNLSPAEFEAEKQNL